MKRRTFLKSAAVTFLGARVAVSHSQTDTPSGKRSGAVHITQTRNALARIDIARRKALLANPEGKSAAELNRLVPEIGAIELHNSVGGGRPGPTLRVIAWNVDRGEPWRSAVKLIGEAPAMRDPDILLLSELDLGMSRSGNGHATRELASALRMNYAYGVEFLELTKGKPYEHRPAENEVGYHGDAILSRYPLRDLRMLRFPGIEKWYHHPVEKRLGGRIALLATITLNGTDLTLVSTHLESDRSDIAVRREQIVMILEELEETSRGLPVILGGDLNGPPDEPLVGELRKAGFTVDESNELGTGTSQRLVDRKVQLSDRHIDYICVRGLKVIREETSPKVVPSVYPPGMEGEFLSDHAAVTVKLATPART
jgi:endonuclease/exonuclease/phosphatase family metal-dependent hydrolase